MRAYSESSARFALMNKKEANPRSKRIIYLPIFGGNSVIMESIRIDILNPKVKAVLKNLAAMKLIRISPQPKQDEFQAFLKKLRVDNPPNLDEIQAEVKAVRKGGHEK